MSLLSVVFIICTATALCFGALAVRQWYRDGADLLDQDGHPAHRDGASADCPSCTPGPEKEF